MRQMFIGCASSYHWNIATHRDDYNALGDGVDRRLYIDLLYRDAYGQSISIRHQKELYTAVAEIQSMLLSSPHFYSRSYIESDFILEAVNSY